jgi:hypothetical protein
VRGLKTHDPPGSATLVLALQAGTTRPDSFAFFIVSQKDQDEPGCFSGALSSAESSVLLFPTSLSHPGDKLLILAGAGQQGALWQCSIAPEGILD